MARLREERLKQIDARYRALPGHFVLNGNTIVVSVNGTLTAVATVFQLSDEVLARNVAAFIGNSTQDIQRLLLMARYLDAQNENLETALASERQLSTQIRDSATIILGGQRTYQLQIESLTDELTAVRERLEVAERDASAYRITLQILRISASVEEAKEIDALLEQAKTGKNAAERIAAWENWWKANEWQIKLWGLKKP